MEIVNVLIRWGLDILLALMLLWLAWRLLATAELFKAIVLFIAFGLLMALAWVRLEAPDLALAEAAIGAGLTGALFLSAWNRMEGPGRDQSAGEEGHNGGGRERTPNG